MVEKKFSVEGKVKEGHETASTDDVILNFLFCVLIQMRSAAIHYDVIEALARLISRSTQ